MHREWMKLYISAVNAKGQYIWGKATRIESPAWENLVPVHRDPDTHVHDAAGGHHRV